MDPDTQPIAPAQVPRSAFEEPPRSAPPANPVLYGPHGLRAEWRVLLYVMLSWAYGFVLMTFAGIAGLSRDPVTPYAVGLLAGLGAGWMMLAFVDRRPIGALGFVLEPAAARDSAVGFGLGGASLGFAVAVLAVAGTARWVADSGTAPEYVAALLGAIWFFGVAAAMEEVVFRGYAFQALVQGIGPWPTMLVTSGLFSLAHVNNPNVDAIALANIFVAGVMLGVAYLKTRSLWFATGVHLGWNWTMSALLDFPVSGLVRDTPLYSARETGADWLTGGEFGPEAGLAATLAVVLLTAWMLRTRRLRESERMRALRPLVDDRLEEPWPSAAAR